jgi:hypothetical protein
MAVREDCRHYLRRSTPHGDAVERCRVGANEDHPFACPEGCLFFEPRSVTSVGWTVSSGEPMSNTGLPLIGLPDPPKKGKGRRKRR